MVELLDTLLYPFLLVNVVLTVDGPDVCLLLVLLFLDLPLFLSLFDLTEEVLLALLIAILDASQALILSLALSQLTLPLPFSNFHLFLVGLVIHLLYDSVGHPVHVELLPLFACLDFSLTVFLLLGQDSGMLLGILDVLEAFKLQLLELLLFLELVLLEHPEKIFLLLLLLDLEDPGLLLLLASQLGVVLDVSPDLVLFLLLLPVADILQLSVPLGLLVHHTALALFLGLGVYLVKALDMLELLPDVLLAFLAISLLADTLVCHLTVKLKLEKSLALLSAILCDLLLLVVQEGVEFDNGVPLVILELPGLSHLGENFLNILPGGGHRGRNRDNSARLLISNGSSDRMPGRHGTHGNTVIVVGGKSVSGATQSR